jgi:hypothetical protein
MIKINIAECRKKGLDANSLLIINIIESRNQEDWSWLIMLLPQERVEKYIAFLIKRNIIEKIEENKTDFHNLRLVAKKKVKVKDSSDFGSFVEEFYNLWPRGIMSGGYAVKSGKASCSTKLRTFLKDHKEYTQEIVLQATKNYIEKCKFNGYQYMKLANYFINKDGVSVLETWCDQIVSGVVNSRSNFSTDV